jgi:hypothetical protein
MSWLSTWPPCCRNTYRPSSSKPSALATHSVALIASSPISSRRPKRDTSVKALCTSEISFPLGRARHKRPDPVRADRSCSRPSGENKTSGIIILMSCSTPPVSGRFSNSQIRPPADVSTVRRTPPEHVASVNTDRPTPLSRRRQRGVGAGEKSHTSSRIARRTMRNDMGFMAFARLVLPFGFYHHQFETIPAPCPAICPHCRQVFASTACQLSGVSQ